MMKKVVSLLLAAMLLVTVSAFADASFTDTLKTIFDEIGNAPDGFRMVLTEDGLEGGLTVQKENGVFRRGVLDTADFSLYFDTEVITVTDEKQNMTIPYAELLSGMNEYAEKVSALGEIFGIMGKELLTGLLIRGGATLEMDDDTMTVRVNADEFFSALDTSVAEILEKYALQIDASVATAFGEGQTINSAALTQIWKQLNVSRINPGFNTLCATCGISSAPDGAELLNITVTADENQIFELKGKSKKNEFALTANVAGHEFDMTMVNGGKDALNCLTVHTDKSELFTLSFTETVMSLSMMEGTVMVSMTKEANGFTSDIIIPDSEMQIETKMALDPFSWTETMMMNGKPERKLAYIQADTEGDTVCRMNVEEIRYDTDGSEKTSSSGSLFINKAENGYALEAEADGEMHSILELTLTPGEITVPDQGILLTQEMLLQLLQMQ